MTSTADQQGAAFAAPGSRAAPMAFDQPVADAGPGEDGLGQDGAAEQRR
jgi:hypothetical protein